MPDPKSTLWNKLKEAGWTPPANKVYVQWTVPELEVEYNTLLAKSIIESPPDPETAELYEAKEVEGSSAPAPTVPDSGPEPVAPAPWVSAPASAPESSKEVPDLAKPAPDGLDALPVPDGALERMRSLYPDLPITDEAEEIAGLHINTHGPDDPIRIDSRGRLWFQDEVRKAAIAKPRMRRKLSYKDTGVRTVTTRNVLGLVEESFEVAGDRTVDMEVKVTLPSWQVGIYLDPNLQDFRIHVYGDQRGLDRMDVLRYFGGKDLVPSTCKTVYVGNDLCYDINSVRDTIERIYRENILRIGPMQ